MRKSEAIAHYRGNVSALARALGLHQSAPYSWGEYPPDKHQLRLERITEHALKAEPECKARALGLDLKREEDRKPKGGKPRAAKRSGGEK
jgi:transposase-like protein